MSNGVRLVCAAAMLVAVGLPRPAAAQYRQLGEDYRVEILGGEWFPPPDPIIGRAAPGADGSDINLVLDLGVESKRFSLWRIVVRPARRHRLRAELLPLKYRAERAPERPLVYDGVTFDQGVPVRSALEWWAWRFGYQYDFISGAYGYVGALAELKYNKVTSRLASAAHERVTTREVLVPGIGVIGRLYLVPEIAVTGEVSGLRLTGSGGEVRRYLDYDLSGVLNFTDNFGLQAGTRSMFVQYRLDQDRGEIEVREKYFAAVVRF